MKKSNLFPIFVALAVPFLVAAAVRPLSPDPCRRTANVPAKTLASELNRVTSTCSLPYCAGSWTCSSTYSHPQPLWSGFNETFTVAQQDAIIKAADQAASSHVPMCGKERTRVIGYQFSTVVVGAGPHAKFAIMVTVSYGVCKGSGHS